MYESRFKDSINEDGEPLNENPVLAASKSEFDGSKGEDSMEQVYLQVEILTQQAPIDVFGSDVLSCQGSKCY